jgi:hypothetical protein
MKFVLNIKQGLEFFSHIDFFKKFMKETQENDLCARLILKLACHSFYDSSVYSIWGGGGATCTIQCLL